MTGKLPSNDSSDNNRPVRTYWLTAGAGTVIVALIAALVALKPWSTSSSPPQPTPSPSRSASDTPTPTPTPTAQAAFIFPRSYATNIPPACKLTATGTVAHLEPNHHLWLFLYFYDDKYYAGNNLNLAKDGRWSGRIYIGGDKQPGQEFVLWLFDLGPKGWIRLNTDINGQYNGFHGWRLANDVTRIAYVDFTTGQKKCQA